MVGDVKNRVKAQRHKGATESRKRHFIRIFAHGSDGLLRRYAPRNYRCFKVAFVSVVWITSTIYLTCNVIASPMKEGVAIPINQPEVNLIHPNHVCLMNYLFIPFNSSLKNPPKNLTLSPGGGGLWSGRPSVHEERD